MNMSAEPKPETKEETDETGESTSGKAGEATLNVRFLWVLLGVMIAMVAMPLLPDGWRNVGGGLLMLWLAYELWVLVYRTFASR